jgi:hypothetical protein
MNSSRPPRASHPSEFAAACLVHDFDRERDTLAATNAQGDKSASKTVSPQ